MGKLWNDRHSLYNFGAKDSVKYLGRIELAQVQEKEREEYVIIYDLPLSI